MPGTTKLRSPPAPPTPPHTHASDNVTCPLLWPNPNCTSLPFTSYPVMVGTRPSPFPLTIMVEMKHVTKMASPWLRGRRGRVCSWFPSVPSEGRRSHHPLPSHMMGPRAEREHLILPSEAGGAALAPGANACVYYVCEQSHPWGGGGINTWH